MASWIGKDVAGELARSEIQNSGPSVGDVVDHDVELELLRPVWIGPLSGPLVRGKLKRDSGGPIVAGYHDPVAAVVGNRQPQELGVEGRERAGIGAVDNRVVKSPNHDLGYYSQEAMEKLWSDLAH